MERAKSTSRTFAPALILLLAAVLINYIDRGSLSLAVPLIKQEWSLSDTQLGILLSSFFWSYTALQIPVGWLSDRLNVSLVLAGGFLLWSAAMAATALATGFAMLLLMRLCLGAGESVMFPAMSKICAEQLPEESRGLANGLMVAAIRWGVAVGTLAGGLLIARNGWRFTFLAVGVVSLLWLPAWMRWRPAPVERAAASRGTTPGMLAIMRQRSFWATSLGHFCGNYLLYFLLTWLPTFLQREHHLSTTMMTLAASAIWTVDSCSSIATGWIADRCIRAGTSATKARKIAMGAGFACASAALCAAALADGRYYWMCMAGIAVGCGVSNSGMFAFAQTLAGPRAAGKWVGMQNCLANFSGITGPALTGYLVDKTHRFGAAFGVAAGVTLIGGLAWCVGVKRVEEVDWGSTAAQ